MSSPDVSFALDSRRAAVGLSGGVMLFDVERRMPIAVYRLSNNVSGISPGGRTIAAVDNNVSGIGPDGHTIAAVDSSNVITLIDTGQHYGIPVNSSRFAIQPDNEHVTTVFSAGGVAIYSIGNPEPIIVRNPADDRSSDKSRGNRVESLSSNGMRYAFTDEQAQKIHLLDVSSSPALEVPIEGNRSDVLQLSFDPSGDFLAGVDKSEITVWSAKNRTEVSRIPLPEGYTTRELAVKLAVSPGGRYVAASNSSGEIWLWDTSSTDHAGTALPFEDGKSMSFSPDGRWLSIGGQDEIRLWDLNAGEFDSRRIPVGGFSMKFSPDSSLLAAQENQQANDISIWNVRDVLLRGTVIWGRDFAFTSDNSRLAVGNAGVFVEPHPRGMEHVPSRV